MKEFLGQIFTKRAVIFLIIVFAVGFIIGWIGIYWMFLEKGFI